MPTRVLFQNGAFAESAKEWDRFPIFANHREPTAGAMAITRASAVNGRLWNENCQNEVQLRNDDNTGNAQIR